jgi:hypothetical protein
LKLLFLSYFDHLPRFRCLGNNVSDFYTKGAGDDGLFVSVSKVTKRITNVALLCHATMDKNTYCVSSIVWAIRSFLEQVGTDFTLQDGVTLCASMIIFNNFEMVVHALISGELA